MKTTGKFDRGQNNGTARCVECGTRRQKGNGQTVDGQFYCNSCYNRAGDDNAVSDGYMTPAEYHALWLVHSEYCPTECTIGEAAEPVKAKGRHVLTAEERSRGGRKAIAGLIAVR